MEEMKYLGIYFSRFEWVYPLDTEGLQNSVVNEERSLLKQGPGTYSLLYLLAYLLAYPAVCRMQRKAKKIWFKIYTFENSCLQEWNWELPNNNH